MKRSDIINSLKEIKNSRKPGDRRKYHGLMSEIVSYSENVIATAERMKIEVAQETKNNLSSLKAMLDRYELYPKIKREIKVEQLTMI